MTDLSVAEVATLAHGYTMAEIDGLARKAAFNNFRGFVVFSYDDMRDTAWHGIVVHLYTVSRPPTFRELLQAGFEAISREHDDFNHHHGVAKQGLPSPNYLKFWRPVGNRSITDGFSDHLVEKMALPHALAVLTGEQYEALATLAAYDNDAIRAADAIGLTFSAFMHRVQTARAKVNVVWFEDETPPKPLPRGAQAATCASGHQRSEWGVQRTRQDGYVYWHCRKCHTLARHRRIARGERDRPMKLVEDGLKATQDAQRTA